MAKKRIKEQRDSKVENDPFDPEVINVFLLMFFLRNTFMTGQVTLTGQGPLAPL